MLLESMHNVVIGQKVCRVQQESIGDFLSSTTGGFLLLATVLLSPILYTMFGASSDAAGVLVAAWIYLSVLIARSAVVPLKMSISSVLIVLGLFLVVVAQGATSFLINHEFHFSRFGQSLLVLLITILGAVAFAYLSST